MAGHGGSRSPGKRHSWMAGDLVREARHVGMTAAAGATMAACHRERAGQLARTPPPRGAGNRPPPSSIGGSCWLTLLRPSPRPIEVRNQHHHGRKGEVAVERGAGKGPSVLLSLEGPTLKRRIEQGGSIDTFWTPGALLRISDQKHQTPGSSFPGVFWWPSRDHMANLVRPFRITIRVA